LKPRTKHRVDNLEVMLLFTDAGSRGVRASVVYSDNNQLEKVRPCGNKTVCLQFMRKDGQYLKREAIVRPKRLDRLQ
jgi:hypothetical protein